MNKYNVAGALMLVLFGFSFLVLIESIVGFYGFLFLVAILSWVVTAIYLLEQ